MQGNIRELVRFNQLYKDAVSRAFARAVEHTGDLGLPQPAFEVRTFRTLEASLGRGPLSGRKRAPEVVRALRSLHGDDLYLAVAVCEFIPEAVARFRDWYGAWIRELTRVMADGAGWAEGLASTLWTALVGTAQPNSAQPLLAAYDGRSALRTWLRVVALRAARSAGHRLAGSPESIELVSHDRSLFRPEEMHALDSALARTLTREPVRARLVFGLTEAHGLTSAQAGHLLDLPPSGVERTLADLRRKLKTAVEQLLRDEHGYDKDALAGYWRRAGRVVGLDR